MESSNPRIGLDGTNSLSVSSEEPNIPGGRSTESSRCIATAFASLICQFPALENSTRGSSTR
jgi:hypothetical protein